VSAGGWHSAGVCSCSRTAQTVSAGLTAAHLTAVIVMRYLVIVVNGHLISFSSFNTVLLYVYDKLITPRQKPLNVN